MLFHSSRPRFGGILLLLAFVDWIQGELTAWDNSHCMKVLALVVGLLVGGHYIDGTYFHGSYFRAASSFLGEIAHFSFR